MIRKAHRDIETMIEKVISSRVSLVKMTSEAAVEALDEKHTWNSSDDKQTLDEKPKRLASPDQQEPMFRETRTTPSDSMYSQLLNR